MKLLFELGGLSGRTLAAVVFVAWAACSVDATFASATTTPTDTRAYESALTRSADTASGRVGADRRLSPPVLGSQREPAGPAVDRFGVAAKAGTDLVKYDADLALTQLTRGGSAKASELVDFAQSQGWRRAQTAAGPIKYVDDNGITRLQIKRGSSRAPGSNFPHVEMRNAAGQRIGRYGDAVNRKDPGNHTPIQWDIP